MSTTAAFPVAKATPLPADEHAALVARMKAIVGNDNVRDLSEQDTPLAAGVEVAVMPAVSGG